MQKQTCTHTHMQRSVLQVWLEKKQEGGRRGVGLWGGRSAPPKQNENTCFQRHRRKNIYIYTYIYMYFLPPSFPSFLPSFLRFFMFFLSFFPSSFLPTFLPSFLLSSFLPSLPPFLLSFLCILSFLSIRAIPCRTRKSNFSKQETWQNMEITCEENCIPQVQNQQERRW